MFVLTFSPLGEKVNTNMALIHRQVKKSTLGKIVNNHPQNFEDKRIYFQKYLLRNLPFHTLIKV